MPVRHVVVDGSNIATEGRNLPNLAQLDQAVREFLGENPDDLITVVVDASFAHRIDPSELPAFEEAEAEGEVVSPPAGAIGRGDAFLLRIAEKTGATVLSNDSFQEFHGEHDWLFDRGRLIGGKPVPGVGWIFTPRTPVRGIKSREAVKEAKRKKRAESPPGSHVEATGLEEAASRGKGRGRKVDRAIAMATEEAVETDEVKRRRRRGSRDTSADPVNEPLAFITFIAAHPLGAEVTGAVDVFSSHGAYVVAEDVRCYIPLSAMGNPPPRSAREVMSKGETRTFVVQALDPMRRGVELALPGFARIASAPTEETVEAEILSGGGEVEEFVEDDFDDATESPGRDGAAEEGTADEIAADEAAAEESVEATPEGRSRSSRRGRQPRTLAPAVSLAVEEAGGEFSGADGSREADAGAAPTVAGGPVGAEAAGAASDWVADGSIAIPGAAAEGAAPEGGAGEGTFAEGAAVDGGARREGAETGRPAESSSPARPARPRRRRGGSELSEAPVSPPPMEPAAEPPAAEAVAPMGEMAGPVPRPGLVPPRRNPARTRGVSGAGARAESARPRVAASPAEPPSSGRGAEGPPSATEPATAEPALPGPGALEPPEPAVSIVEPSVAIKRAPGRRPAAVARGDAAPGEEPPKLEGADDRVEPAEEHVPAAARAEEAGDASVAPAGPRARKRSAARKVAEPPIEGRDEPAPGPRKTGAAPRAAGPRKTAGSRQAAGAGEAAAAGRVAPPGKAAAPEKAAGRRKAAGPTKKAAAPRPADGDRTAGGEQTAGEETASGALEATARSAAARRARQGVTAQALSEMEPVDASAGRSSRSGRTAGKKAPATKSPSRVSPEPSLVEAAEAAATEVSPTKAAGKKAAGTKAASTKKSAASKAPARKASKVPSGRSTSPEPTDTTAVKDGSATEAGAARVPARARAVKRSPAKK